MSINIFIFEKAKWYIKSTCNDKISLLSFDGKQCFELGIKNNYVIILRLFSIHGIGLKKQIIWDACKNFKLKKPIFRGTGLEKRDFLNIKDFTRLISIIILSLIHI